MKIRIFVFAAIMLLLGGTAFGQVAGFDNGFHVGDASEYDNDNDGIADSVDNCPYVYNPYQDDEDEDTVGDSCDNCITTANQYQEDYDVNGVGDACDATELLFGDRIALAEDSIALICSGDFNNDGYADLAAIQQFSYAGVCPVFVSLGNGDGSFQSATEYDLAGAAYSDFASADLNNDGFDDIVSIKSSGAVVLLNDTTGGFDTTTYILPGYNNTAAIQDFNNDGYKDLAVNRYVGTTGYRIYLLYNDSTGSFPVLDSVHTYMYKPPVETYDTYNLISADIDQDGYYDLITGFRCSFPDTIAIFQNMSGSSFDAYRYITCNMSAYMMVAGDFDGDSLVDFVVGGDGPQGIGVFLNNGSDYFSPSYNQLVYSGTNGSVLVELATDGITNNGIVAEDFDGDGDLDLAMTASVPSGVVVLLNDGSGSFSLAPYYGTYAVPYSLTSAEFNGDCVPDIAIAGDSVSVLFNQTISECPYVYGDANGDGVINVFDVTYLEEYIYLQGPPPVPMNAGDPNGDCIINIFDVTYLVSFLYLSGPAPVAGCVE